MALGCSDFHGIEGELIMFWNEVALNRKLRGCMQ